MFDTVCLTQIVPMKYDPRDEASIKAVMAKANVVINLIGMPDSFIAFYILKISISWIGEIKSSSAVVSISFGRKGV